MCSDIKGKRLLKLKSAKDLGKLQIVKGTATIVLLLLLALISGRRTAAHVFQTFKVPLVLVWWMFDQSQEIKQVSFSRKNGWEQEQITEDELLDSLPYLEFLMKVQGVLKSMNAYNGTVFCIMCNAFFCNLL